MSPRFDGEGLRILTVGTGGQGVLTAARLLTRFFVAKGHDVVSGQLHGMAQRGGSVQSSIQVDCGLSPVIGEGRADVVLGLEPIECARAIRFMSSRTTVLMNVAMVTPFVVAQDEIHGRNGAPPSVSELERAIRELTPHVATFDATALAERAGSERTLNVVMLGALFRTGRAGYEPRDFMESVGLADENARAFQMGAEVGAVVG